ncbi:MAG: DUF4177 domain-containing protein [Burkholderiaceae bacterium]|nr:DUF4177 domain-containing protein [Burkholderiaceae bacterium]
MKYTYKMVQVPPNIEVEAKKHKGSEAAHYLQNVVNAHAEDGWEFHRIDQIGVDVKPGCFSGLLGQKTGFSTYHVISFRREVNA